MIFFDIKKNFLKLFHNVFSGYFCSKLSPDLEVLVLKSWGTWLQAFYIQAIQRFKTQLQNRYPIRKSADLFIHQSHPYTTLNSVEEASLGLGWGSYFCHENIYLNVSMSYD